MHETTASTYYTIAMIYYHMADYASALAYQQKGIVILEKIHGYTQTYSLSHTYICI
jgi:hypothetical protein